MVKRCIDVVLGTILAIVALPVIILMALISAAVLRTWPLFVQERVGYQGQRFKVPKLRTLPRTVSTIANKYEVARLELPWFCRMLRAAHLDELPQLLLVPLGRMSLVGPRPEMPHMHASGDIAFARERVAVRPGCTGLWQVSADADRLIWEAPEYDVFYVRNVSPRLDLWIMWRTLLFLTGIGPATTLDQVPAWAADPTEAELRSLLPLDGAPADAAVATVNSASI